MTGRSRNRTKILAALTAAALGLLTVAAMTLVRPPGYAQAAGAAPYALTAAVLNADQIAISWQTDRADITGWNVARNGQDDRGNGPWNTDVAASVRTYTFNILVAGFDYTFTLTPLTAAGAEAPVTVVANTAGTPTTPTPTVPPTTSDTAAARFGWGTPLPASDEFNYTGTPNTSRWSLAGGGAGQCWPGHSNNGRRCDANTRVNGNALVQTGSANGDTGWLASTFDQRYGRWEVRVRSFNTGTNNGRQYHPLLIIWPYRENWPVDGEYDFLENGAPGQACAEAFIHYPHPASAPVQQEHATETNCGTRLSEWHNIAVDWQPTGIKGYINGVQWFSYSGGAGPHGRSAIQAMPSGHLTIQLDNFYGGSMTPASYEIDWVRVYQP